MSCQRFERLGPAWAAGDLSARQRARLERHLAECADCRARVAALQAATAETRQSLAQAPELSAEEWRRVQAALEAPAARPARVWAWAGLAAAAAALLLALGLWFLPNPGPAADGGDDGRLGPAPAERVAAVDRFELRFATSDPKVKIVWVFDRNFKL
ncbi:MAG TPA: zf-HC2 domain-containing protein [Myxococcota bacterium]|nr:zf-HC2 domain-containing protein [Myxococcota bacterium]HRY97066.1 zf-HC2 domain-containing protein [Myxococcota bacterium]HSA21453.1 zf-HC2 domain-containing protein [Myxococcota bacterium]